MKVEFVTPLDTRRLGGGEFLLTAPFICVVDGERIEVPEGFTCDGDSIPRWPFIYWIAKGHTEYAACLHDFCYRVLRRGWRWADRVMKAAMVTEAKLPAVVKAGKLRPRHQFLIYLGVRVGGWWAYYVRPET